MNACLGSCAHYTQFCLASLAKKRSVRRFFASTLPKMQGIPAFLVDLNLNSGKFKTEMANQYTIQMSRAEAELLYQKLQERAGYEPITREYAEFCFEGPQVQVSWYPKKGKLLIQGKGADDFLEFVLLLAPGDLPPASRALPALLDKEPHFGVDESGKGDYFGPLVIAGVYSCGQVAEQLLKLGCRDSKTIGSDDQMIRMSARIRQLPGIAYEVVCIGPHRYNEIYQKMGNLNRLLAWGHARVIAALHEKVPSCHRALSDQFANEWVLRRALGQRHLPVQLEQRPRAESDVAVAAASILARAHFVQWMRDAAQAAGCSLPLGCAPHVVKAAKQFVCLHGTERLGDVAKLHFKVTAQVLPKG